MGLDFSISEPLDVEVTNFPSGGSSDTFSALTLLEDEPLAFGDEFLIEDIGLTDLDGGFPCAKK